MILVSRQTVAVSLRRIWWSSLPTAVKSTAGSGIMCAEPPVTVPVHFFASAGLLLGLSASHIAPYKCGNGHAKVLTAGRLVSSWKADG